MEQAIILNRKARSTVGLSSRLIARVTKNADHLGSEDEVLIVKNENALRSLSDEVKFRAILAEDEIDSKLLDGHNIPVVAGLKELGEISDDSIVAISPSGAVRTLYRPESRFNSIFATGNCNSNCLMCSQPPVEDDFCSMVEENLRLISLIKATPESMGISGGEPTLLGDGLVEIIAALRLRFPEMPITMLTNGRLLSNLDLARNVATAATGDFLFAVPLYADVPDVHDWIVQAKGAFSQTLEGLYNLARFGKMVEIRVVLHKQTIPRLTNLMDFIYRNLPFSCHVALMGLENMGYVKKNWDQLWIDPLDYASELSEAVRRLHYRGMSVSIYNLPLCVVPQEVRPFARQSISDYKNIYIDECSSCGLRSGCSGLFSSSIDRHSKGIIAQGSLSKAVIQVPFDTIQ